MTFLFLETIRAFGVRFPSRMTSTSLFSALHPLDRTWEHSRNLFWIPSPSVHLTSCRSRKPKASGSKSGTLSLKTAWEIKSRRFSFKTKHNWTSSIQSCIQLHNKVWWERDANKEEDIFVLLSFFMRKRIKKWKPQKKRMGIVQVLCHWKDFMASIIMLWCTRPCSHDGKLFQKN